ncbi:hypothetical protein GCM10025857_23190 [Alicyclobacillus contaminans]|nr:hypothetical protein GCM10025857_23190 [Alicyclobacillus contaminans]
MLFVQQVFCCPNDPAKSYDCRAGDEQDEEHSKVTPPSSNTSITPYPANFGW